MTGHAQLQFVMTECSKTQIRLTGLILFVKFLCEGFAAILFQEEKFYQPLRCLKISCIMVTDFIMGHNLINMNSVMRVLGT